MYHRAAVLMLILVLLSACQSAGARPADERSPTVRPAEAAPTATPAPAATSVAASPLDLTRLPLGDSRHSTAPQAGWIWPCHIGSDAGGAFQDGPWINADGTYDSSRKLTVDGTVTWPYEFTIAVQADRRLFSTNNLPDHATGNYPISQNDDVYQYDRNPNQIASQDFSLSLPASPSLAAQPTCVPGAVGILLSGAVLFNALDAVGRDAVAHETQDSCQGHPQVSGVYHYHSLTSCIIDAPGSDGHSSLLGYSLDGFGIYGHHGLGGATLSSADLDECHGHSHMIDWDGTPVAMYHYHATADFPYTIGCMRGTYSMQDVMSISGAGQAAERAQPNQEGGQPNSPPDLAAAATKLGISEAALRAALGSPPPDLAAAATKLGISEAALRAALGSPPP
jgi:hypothetical protein